LSAIYDNHSPALAPKLLLVGLNGLGVLAGAVLMFGFMHADPLRASLIVACSFVYFLRIIGTTFMMLPRTVRYAEAVGVGCWIIVIHLTMAVFAGLNTSPVGWIALVGIVLYLSGSTINTGSEWLRKRWKADPSHAGQLYTGGFFRYAVHINYFGDVVLFTGFALITGSAWPLIIPALMACLFVFGNIPMLDKHLREHYGEAFEQYSARTAKFVPFVY
jgi:steroid 5-alpha reductase family enzyme